MNVNYIAITTRLRDDIRGDQLPRVCGGRYCCDYRGIAGSRVRYSRRGFRVDIYVFALLTDRRVVGTTIKYSEGI